MNAALFVASLILIAVVIFAACLSVAADERDSPDDWDVHP